MLLIFGTRTARHSIGYVAEECPCCGTPTVCRILEVSRGGHFFYIPTGRGSFPLGHEARCLSCRHPFDVPAVYYHGFGKKKKAAVSELIPLTSPWLETTNAQEQQDEWRFRRILDIFMRYDGSFRERSLRGGMQFDWVGGLAVLMLIFVPTGLAGLVMSDNIPLLSKSQSVAMAWIVSIIAVIWGIYMIMTEERRFFRRNTLLRLHAELAPLAAQKSDWETAMRRMRRLRFPSWRMLKAECRRGDFSASHGEALPAHAPGSTEAGTGWQPPHAPLTLS